MSWRWVATRPVSTFMKNPGTRDNRKDLPPEWQAALVEFDRSLQAHGMSEKTRRAYGVDLGELAAFAAEAGAGPRAVDHRLLRRYAARLSSGVREGGRALSRPTIARKL